MISLFYDENNIVNLIYYVSIPSELEHSSKLEVKTLEEPQEKEGMKAILKADKTHYWYEYEKEEKTSDKKLEERLEATEEAMADIMMMLGGMQ